MKKIAFILFSITSAFYSNAQGIDSIYIKANEYYTKGNFEEAATLYENILEQGYESAELYYNLANTYYKQNVISRAILNYEKALKLDPNDDDIKYNLELANRLVVDKIEVLPVFFIKTWIIKLRNIFTSDIWAIISVSAFIFTLIFISFFLYSKNLSFKKLSFWISFLILIITVISILFSYQQKQKIIKGNTAIVMSPSVTVKSSPDISGTDLFVIHEGTKVWIDDQISGWNEIMLSDGSKGWLKAEDIELI